MSQETNSQFWERVAKTDPPIGYREAEKDFLGVMTYHDWASLTLGEQARYAARECQTSSAVYSSKISGNEITFSVSLPRSLAMDGLTEDDARKLKSFLHRKMEEQIVAILQLRQIRATAPAPFAPPSPADGAPETK